MTATAAPAAKYPKVQNYIGGKFVAAGGQMLEVLNPADGSLLSHVPLSGPPELDAAVRAAAAAFPAWSATPIKERVQVFFRYKTLLERDIDELSALITEENGKIRERGRGGDAQGHRADRVRLLAAADRRPARCWR